MRKEVLKTDPKERSQNNQYIEIRGTTYNRKKLRQLSRGVADSIDLLTGQIKYMLAGAEHTNHYTYASEKHIMILREARREFAELKSDIDDELKNDKVSASSLESYIQKANKVHKEKLEIPVKRECPKLRHFVKLVKYALFRANKVINSNCCFTSKLPNEKPRSLRALVGRARKSINMAQIAQQSYFDEAQNDAINHYRLCKF